MLMVKEKNKEFSVVLLSQYCKGCRLCVSVCEAGKIEIEPGPNERGIQPVRTVDGVRCTGCLRCTAVCPDAAIEIYRGDATASGDAEE